MPSAMQNMSWNVANETGNATSIMSEGRNGERQQKFIEKTRKIDQQITSEKRKICQRNRRKEKKHQKKTKAKRRLKKTDIREKENLRNRCRRTKRQQKRQ